MNKTVLLDTNGVDRCLTRIAHETIEKNKYCEDICLVGIYRRGAVLAKVIADKIKTFTDIDVPVGTVDISLYRDDLSKLFEDPKLNKSDIPFDITGKTVILVDDVIYTGRTVRAAMEAVISKGRPSRIQLAVLIDRGHRELPIKSDYVGKNVPTSQDETVCVCVDEYDGRTCVEILSGKKI